MSLGGGSLYHVGWGFWLAVLLSALVDIWNWHFMSYLSAVCRYPKWTRGDARCLVRWSSVVLRYPGGNSKPTCSTAVCQYARVPSATSLDPVLKSRSRNIKRSRARVLSATPWIHFRMPEPQYQTDPRAGTGMLFGSVRCGFPLDRDTRPLAPSAASFSTWCLLRLPRSRALRSLCFAVCEFTIKHATGLASIFDCVFSISLHFPLSLTPIFAPPFLLHAAHSRPVFFSFTQTRPPRLYIQPAAIRTFVPFVPPATFFTNSRNCDYPDFRSLGHLRSTRSPSEFFHK